jgi:xanthosine utilization system XapX-like protein
VALVGLEGILLGEQLVPLGKRLIAGEPLTLAAVLEQSREHVFGQLPQRQNSSGGRFDHEVA